MNNMNRYTYCELAETHLIYGKLIIMDEKPLKYIVKDNYNRTTETFILYKMSCKKWNFTNLLLVVLGFQIITSLSSSSDTLRLVKDYISFTYILFRY